MHFRALKLVGIALVAAVTIAPVADAQRAPSPYGDGYARDGYDYGRDAYAHDGRRTDRDHRGHRPRRGDRRCDRGTGGTILGAIAGGLLGNAAVGRHGNSTAGTLAGAGVGALAGNAIDRDC